MRAWTAYAALLALPFALATGAASAQAQGGSVDPIAAFRCEQAHETANYGDAFRACAPLAEQGLTDAQLILADLYLRGLGVPQNLSEAARWHRAAAEQGGAAGPVQSGYAVSLRQRRTAGPGRGPHLAQ